MYNYPACCIQQVELFNATTMKKEAMPGLHICNFLSNEVCMINSDYN